MRIALPNGVDLIGLACRNAVENLRGGFAPRVSLPPTFRLARLVTGGLAPLRVVTRVRDDA